MLSDSCEKIPGQERTSVVARHGAYCFHCCSVSIDLIERMRIAPLDKTDYTFKITRTDVFCVFVFAAYNTFSLRGEQALHSFTQAVCPLVSFNSYDHVCTRDSYSHSFT